MRERRERDRVEGEGDRVPQHLPGSLSADSSSPTLTWVSERWREGERVREKETERGRKKEGGREKQR